MKITSLHQQTSLERVQPESGFGDVGEGGIVQGQGGIPMVGTLGDGQVWVYDSGSGTLIPGTVGATAGMVPYYIAPAATFTVPLYKQALYSTEIDNEGTLEVIGLLLEVS